MALSNLQSWIQENCQLIYGMLNAKAKKQLPAGLTEYLGGDSLADIKGGQETLSTIEKALATLVGKCGWENVAGNYRRDLSAVNSVNQVSELFCEIALCASLVEISQDLKLRPPTGKGTYSDCLFTLSGIDIYGEAKRYEDPWPHIEKVGKNSESRIPYSRSISRTASGQKPNDTARPRSMDLRSKLRDVHRQFPNRTVNVLFVFHPSLGETRKYIAQALFGDSAFHQNDSVYRLEREGLFSVDEWRNVSACCLARVNPEAKVVFPVIWENPRAWAALPQVVSIELKRITLIRPPDVKSKSIH